MASLSLTPKLFIVSMTALLYLGEMVWGFPCRGETPTPAAKQIVKGFQPRFSAKTRGLFLKRCAYCHLFKDLEGPPYRDLSLIGQTRSKEYIEGYIRNPSGLNPRAVMPGFENLVSAKQIDTLAQYLYQAGR